MNIASIFDWFAQDSAYAAEHTDEPRQRGMWLQLAEQWEAAALQASNGVRWCVVLTAAARGGLIALLAWVKSSRSGSARHGLSQKGGLPFPSETAYSERRSKAADAR
jgi:NAD dependent epimerase/dehydratase family enzyme